MSSTLSKLCFALLGWFFIAPLTLIFPRTPQRIVIIGRDGGKFLDNTKYVYIALLGDPDLRPTFLGNPNTVSSLTALGAEAIPATGGRALWACVRAGTVFVDSIDWGDSMRHAACRGARIVQLWHGIPLKEIELAVLRKKLQRSNHFLQSLWQLYNWVTGRYAKVDVLLCTSDQVRNVFLTCFHATRVSTAGYPRNDVLLDTELQSHPMVRASVDGKAAQSITQYRARGGKHVALYAPTFRNNLLDPLDSAAVDIRSLSRAAESLGLLLLIKLHPWADIKSRNIELPGIVRILPETDVYPLMNDVDILITDYSSIYFDYLLLNRPILFYPYDYDEYVRDERALLYDYATMTPGPKAHNLNALVDEIGRATRGEDEFASDRERVRRLIFDHADQHATARLLSELFP